MRGRPHILEKKQNKCYRKHLFYFKFICVILRLAVLVEHRLVTDGRTDVHRPMASTADA